MKKKPNPILLMLIGLPLLLSSFTVKAQQTQQPSLQLGNGVFYMRNFKDEGRFTGLGLIGGSFNYTTKTFTPSVRFIMQAKIATFPKAKTSILLNNILMLNGNLQAKRLVPTHAFNVMVTKKLAFAEDKNIIVYGMAVSNLQRLGISNWRPPLLAAGVIVPFGNGKNAVMTELQGYLP